LYQKGEAAGAIFVATGEADKISKGIGYFKKESG
jgi:hypothetical protein